MRLPARDEIVIYEAQQLSPHGLGWNVATRYEARAQEAEYLRKVLLQLRDDLMAASTLPAVPPDLLKHFSLSANTDLLVSDLRWRDE